MPSASPGAASIKTSTWKAKAFAVNDKTNATNSKTFKTKRGPV